MIVDNVAEEFTKRIVFRPYTVALMMTCGVLSLADVSQLPKVTANFSAMPFREEKAKSALVMAWPHVGCFWAIIYEWKIDACKL